MTHQPEVLERRTAGCPDCEKTVVRTTEHPTYFKCVGCDSVVRKPS